MVGADKRLQSFPLTAPAPLSWRVCHARRRDMGYNGGAPPRQEASAAVLPVLFKKVVLLCHPPLAPPVPLILLIPLIPLTMAPPTLTWARAARNGPPIRRTPRYD